MSVSLLALVTERRPWLAGVLLEYARHRRWFRAKARNPRDARVFDVIALDAESLTAATQALVLLQIGYEGGGDPDLYAIPVAFAEARAVAAVGTDAPAGPSPGPSHGVPQVQGVIAAASDGVSALVDGLVTGQAAAALLRLVRDSATHRGEAGDLTGEAGPLFSELAGDSAGWEPRIPQAEQTNSTVTLGERLQMKIYRHLTAGPNPELEVGRFLTESCRPPCAPRVAGALTYRRADGVALSLGIVHEYLRNDGDAWSLALGELRMMLRPAGDPSAWGGAPRFPSLVETLGRRTGELHRALCAGAVDGGGGDGLADPDFLPEPLSAADRALLAARARAMLDDNLRVVERSLDSLSVSDRALAQSALSVEARGKLGALIARFEEEPIAAVKTRTHGDLHLGQVLVRGDDFVIIDFEGEPVRPLAERRAKNSPFRDVMGMVRSFAYAPEAALRESAAQDGDVAVLRARTELAARWTRDVTARYLRGYLETVGDAPFVPQSRDHLSLLLAFHELERVIYEVGYEINNRPDWVSIPLGGLAAIAGVGDGGVAAAASPVLDGDYHRDTADDGDGPSTGRPTAGGQI